MNIELGADREGKVEEIRELLTTVSDMVPSLLKEIRGVLYSKEAAESMADAVGTFYRKLVEAGVPREDAMEMTRGYMINLRDLVRGKGVTVGEHRSRRAEE